MNGIRLKIAIAFYCILLANHSLAQDEAGCLDCHTNDSNAGSSLHAVYNSAHGNIGGGGSAACTSCHGTSNKHDRRGRKSPPDISFGPTWPSPVTAQNESCLSCHENGQQLLWIGSEHQQESLACNDCHTSHQQRDPALHKERATEQCTTCHSRARAEMHLPSRHPIAEGKTACTDCHNPHGSAGEASLHQVSVNDNCLECHEEKRGPFLWEHEPVAEDCTLCHRPHGSVVDRLLTTRGPALCQQCHAAAFHPSVPYGGEALVGGSANPNLLGKNCLNCHGLIHGSNHPSGARLTR